MGPGAHRGGEFRRIRGRLGDFVEAIWQFDSCLQPGRDRILPTGKSQVLINLDADVIQTATSTSKPAVITGGAAFDGVRTEPVLVETSQQRSILGITFRIGGAAAFFRPPQSAIAGHVDLSDLWGPLVREMRDRVIEATSASMRLDIVEGWLQRLLAHDARRDGAVDQATRWLDEGIAVAQVRQRLGFTSSRLVRRFRQHLGLSPKEYARLARFRRLVDRIEPGAPIDWADLAAACGYYDQAHCIHEFKEFAGVTPTAYRPRNHLEKNHLFVAEEPTVAQDRRRDHFFQYDLR